MSARQFNNLRAESLYCRGCGAAMPVRERLLLVLPEKELYEYLCQQCGATVGSREVSAAEQVMRREAARGSGPQVRIL
jgi:ribosomal protein L40E